MRKTFTPLIILVISFLSFIIPVYAAYDTSGIYNITLPSNLTSLTSSIFTTMINTLDNTSMVSKDYCIITWMNDTANPYKAVCGNTLTFNSETNYQGTFKLGSSCRAYYYNSDFTTLTQESRNFNCSSLRYSYTSDFNYNALQHLYIIYTSPTFYYPNNNFIIIFIHIFNSINLHITT